MAVIPSLRVNGVPVELTASTDVIIGTADTSGVRLDVSAGTLRVREGDNSAAAPMSAGAATFSDVLSGTIIAANNYVEAANDFRFAGSSRIQNQSDGSWRFRTSSGSNTYDITLADWGTTTSPEAVSVANAGVIFLGTAPLGVLNVTIGTDDDTARIRVRGASNGVSELEDPGNNCSITKDNASTLNFYYDAAGPSGAGYYMQNNRGGTRAVRLRLEGA